MTRRPPHRAVVSVQVQVPVSNETPSDYGRLRPKPSTHRRSHWGPPVSKTFVCCDWDTPLSACALPGATAQSLVLKTGLITW